MPRISFDVWLEHARRYVAVASEIAQQAETRAHEVQTSTRERRRRSRDLIAKGEAALARGRKRRSF